MKLRCSWIGRIVALGLLAATPSAAGQILARVDGRSITLTDMKRAFERQHQGHMTILAEEAVVRDFLESMIRRELFTQEGLRMGMDELPRIREQVAKERNRVAGEWLYQSEIQDRVRVKKSAIDAALERMRISIHVILIQTDGRDEAERARELVLSGAPAADVAREVSRARSSVRGGLQGLIWGQTDMPELELAALAAEPGEVTPVVPVEEGFCFVKVLSRERLELPNLDAARRSAKSVLRSRAVERRRHEYLDGLRRRYSASIDEALLRETILELAARDAGDRQREKLEEGQERAIARFDGGSIPLSEFTAAVDPDKFAAIRPALRELQARQLLENKLDSALLRVEGDARWPSAPAEVKTRLRVIEDDLIFQHLLGNVVFKDLGVDVSEIDDWYAEHRDEYVEPESIRLAIALLETEEEADRFLEEADDTARFADLATKRSVDPDTAKQGGVAGWVTRDKAIPQLREQAFEVAVDNNGGPIPMESGFLVYRVLERRESFPTPEAEARARVRKVLLERKSKEHLDSWASQLREAAVIRLNDASIRKACRILTREKEARAASRRAVADSGRPVGSE